MLFYMNNFNKRKKKKMKNRFLGICVLGSMFLLSGCGQPNSKNMGPGDEAYSCGVFSVILDKHKNAVTVSVWSAPTARVPINRNGYFKYGNSTKRFFKRGGKYYFNPDTSSNVRDSLQLISCKRVK